MKKHLSILQLYARSSIFPVVLTLGAMVTAQIAAYRNEIESILARNRDHSVALVSFEDSLASAPFPFIFALAYLIIAIILCRPGCRFGSRTDYTFARLGIGDRAAYFWQAGYNAAVFLVLAATELGVLLACSAIYAAALPGSVTGQTLFLASYRSGLFHALLPLGDWPLWGRNLLILAGLALSIARFPVCRRAGKLPIAAAIMIMTALFFPRGLGETAYDFLVFWPTATVVATSLWLTLRKEEYDD